MNFRRIFIFGLWLALGVVGIGIVLPELNRSRSGTDRATGNRDAPPDASVFANIGSELDGVTARVSDDVESIDSLFGSAVGSAPPGSVGMSGIGAGGGGTSYGSGAGIGSIGASTSATPNDPDETKTSSAEPQASESSDNKSGTLGLSGTIGKMEGYGRGQSIGSGGGGKSIAANGHYPGLGSGATADSTSAAPGAGRGLDLSDPQISSTHPGSAPSAEEPTTELPPQAAMTAPMMSAAPEESTSETDDLMAELDRKLASLPLANIAFNTPETIPLGDDATIELLLSLQETEAQLREAIRDAGPTESARIQISDQMEARLTGLGFRIEAITPDRQAVSRGQRTWWRWQIEPTKSDTLELHLTLSAIVTIDGVPAPRTVQTFKRIIYVDVPLATQVTQFAKSNIEIITTFFLIPVVGGLYRHVRNKKRQTAMPEFDERPRRAA